MKPGLLVILSLFTLLASRPKCSTAPKEEACYKGILAIKGICLHYVVVVTDPRFDTTQLTTSWTDPTTDTTYHNVFTISNPCRFPAAIAEGDTIYFKLDSSAAENCVRCMAYREVPPAQLAIKVFKESCR